MKPDLESIVRNQSSREGGRPHLIILHTTQGHDRPGLSDLESLAAEFNDPASQASSHMATDGEGHIARYVYDKFKAWSVCSFNPYTLNIEQVGFAEFSTAQWFQRPLQLKATAAICAQWSFEWGIPLRKGRIGSGLEIKRDGILQHKDLGILGCGHVDCGSGYPQGYVIRLAQLILEEHHFGRPYSRRAKRLRRKLNRQRKRYQLPPFVPEHKSSTLVAGTNRA